MEHTVFPFHPTAGNRRARILCYEVTFAQAGRGPRAPAVIRTHRPRLWRIAMDPPVTPPCYDSSGCSAAARPLFEPPREFRRLVAVSHAAMLSRSSCCALACTASLYARCEVRVTPGPYNAHSVSCAAAAHSRITVRLERWRVLTGLPIRSGCRFVAKLSNTQAATGASRAPCETRSSALWTIVYA